MKVTAKAGKDTLATVYIAETDGGEMIEFVESLQPPYTINEKWVLIISTLCGCPVDCGFCDAGGNYKRKLTEEELFSQIDFMVTQRYPDRVIPSEKFKIQFSRIGEPSFNSNVLNVLRNFNGRYTTKNFIPSISTIAPKGSDNFFEELLCIKKDLYKNNFQLQFSLHTTNVPERDRLIPVPKWPFGQIAAYGERFFDKEGKKITLNFTLAEGSKCEPEILRKYFNPGIFLVKFTPLNPTFKAQKNGLKSYIKEPVKGDKSTENINQSQEIFEKVKDAGYEIILSIGEFEENKIGSNCGQYISAIERNSGHIIDGYTYKINYME